MDITVSQTSPSSTYSFKTAGTYVDEDINLTVNTSSDGEAVNYMTVDKFNAIFGTAYNETITVSNGTFTNTGCSLKLIGSTLRLYVNGTANASKSAGNITNEKMFTITFTDAKIIGMYDTVGVFGKSGPLASLKVDTSDSGSSHTLGVYLNAIGTSISKNAEVDGYINIPVTLNYDAY